MSDIDRILASLELIAELNIDVTAETYERYFTASPESIELMDHTDHLMRGRMLEALIMLVTMPEGEQKQGTLTFEVHTHSANGVKPLMYLQLFQSFHGAVKDACGDDWSDETEGAWTRETAQLMDKIETIFKQS